jgi:hypothetical protein
MKYKDNSRMMEGAKVIGIRTIDRIHKTYDLTMQSHPWQHEVVMLATLGRQ